MKKIIRWLVVFIVVSVLAVGCGKSMAQKAAVESAVKESKSYEAVETEEVTEGITETADVEDVSIAEQVIYEGNDVVIKVTGAEKTYSGIKINIYIENNGSLNLGFNAHSYAVNGIMTANNIYDMDCDVAAGKKANTSFEIENSFFDKFGIDKLRNIDILFWAYDNDEWFKSFETNVIHISTSLDDGTYTSISGQNIYDANGVKVDYLDKTGDYFTFVLTNTTGNYFNFDVANITINDYTSSDMDFDLYDEQVLNNCQYVFTIEPSSDFKSANGITSIEKVEFSLNYRSLGDYFNEQSTDMMGCTL